jgi:integrase
MDMRRTKITEMVENGVDITQIMAVSGHQNIQSVTPYLKHTLKSAKSALSKTQSLNIFSGGS